MSKSLIKNTVSNILKNSNYNLWMNSYDAIERFKKKRNATFIQFDIMDFYSSITKLLFLNCINHVRNFIDITDEQL